MDCYYFDLSSRPEAERCRVNFDDPEAIDHVLLRQHLLELSQGKEIGRPVYDFTTHTRTQERTPVQPGDFVIIEGLFVLYWSDIRSLLATGIFVNLPDDHCLQRRILRDVCERGRTEDLVRRQFAETVQPMAEMYIMPTRVFADIVISGDDPMEKSVNAVLAHLASKGWSSKDCRAMKGRQARFRPPGGG